MKNQISISISFVLLLVTLVPNSFASTQNSTLDSQGNYANPSLGVTFQAPAGWTVQEPKNSQPGAPDIAVIAPYSNGFTASISFSVEKANGTSLDNYFENKKSQLVSSDKLNDITLLSEQDDTINGIAAKTLLLEENFTSQGNSNAIKFKQYIVLANEKFYTITYANLASNFDSDLPNYEQVLNSIKFENTDMSFLFDYVSIGIVGGALVVGAAIAIRRRKSHSQKDRSVA